MPQSAPTPCRQPGGQREQGMPFAPELCCRQRTRSAGLESREQPGGVAGHLPGSGHRWCCLVLHHLPSAALRDAYGAADLVATGTTESLRWLLLDARSCWRRWPLGLMCAASTRPPVIPSWRSPLHQPSLQNSGTAAIGRPLALLGTAATAVAGAHRRCAVVPGGDSRAGLHGVGRALGHRKPALGRAIGLSPGRRKWPAGRADGGGGPRLKSQDETVTRAWLAQIKVERRLLRWCAAPLRRACDASVGR